MTDTSNDDDVPWVDEVVVIGVRPVVGQPKIYNEEMLEIDPEGGSGGVWRPAEVPREIDRQKDCAADRFKKELESEEPEEKDEKEFFSFTWFQGNQIVTISPQGGGGRRRNRCGAIKRSVIRIQYKRIQHYIFHAQPSIGILLQ
ncbi:hypothetical protein [Brevundimonas sp.]|uniref:hypothetical protein n=1 Tax=Brevundimonas sp. TaxID=1871086 RepID=UPI0035AF25A1